MRSNGVGVSKAEYCNDAFASLGMRLLLEDRMNVVMRHVDSMMSNSSFQPFLYTSPFNARILSGEEEGVFAWIAVNYLLGVFSNNICKHS